jgi:hypothetical protein
MGVPIDMTGSSQRAVPDPVSLFKDDLPDDEGSKGQEDRRMVPWFLTP